jgi:pentatricopeptide repeat protein
VHKNAVADAFSPPSTPRHSYTSLIDACGKTQQLKRAHELLNQMQEEGVQPNAHTFTTIINACAQAQVCAKSSKEQRVGRRHEAQSGGVVLDGEAGAPINWERAVLFWGEEDAPHALMRPRLLIAGSRDGAAGA